MIMSLKLTHILRSVVKSVSKGSSWNCHGFPLEPFNRSVQETLIRSQKFTHMLRIDLKTVSGVSSWNSHYTIPNFYPSFLAENWDKKFLACKKSARFFIWRPKEEPFSHFVCRLSLWLINEQGLFVNKTASIKKATVWANLWRRFWLIKQKNNIRFKELSPQNRMKNKLFSRPEAHFFTYYSPDS